MLLLADPSCVRIFLASEVSSEFHFCALLFLITTNTMPPTNKRMDPIIRIKKAAEYYLQPPAEPSHVEQMKLQS